MKNTAPELEPEPFHFYKSSAALVEPILLGCIFDMQRLFCLMRQKDF